MIGGGDGLNATEYLACERTLNRSRAHALQQDLLHRKQLLRSSGRIASRQRLLGALKLGEQLLASRPCPPVGSARCQQRTEVGDRVSGSSR